MTESKALTLAFRCLSLRDIVTRFSVDGNLESIWVVTELLLLQ